MKISRFAFFFKENDLSLAYCSRTNALFEITDDLLSFFVENKHKEEIDISFFDKQTSDFLIEQKIIISPNEDQLYIRELLFKTQQIAFSNEHLSLIISPTTQCNFRCFYCFEPNKDYQTMSAETIDNLISFIKKHENSKKMSITWYGGEPLMAIDVIEKILNKITTTVDIPLVNHEIITNGYYFDNKAIDLFKKYPLNQIQITLDGLKERHDKIRKMHTDNSPSYDTIIRNMDAIIEQLPNTFLSVRVNIDKTNEEHFLKTQKFLTTRWQKHSNYEIYPGFIRLDNNCATDFSDKVLTENDAASFTQKINKCNHSSDYPVIVKKNCTANRINAYIIGSIGEIYKCWNDVTDNNKIVGYINEEQITNRQLFYDYLFSTAWFEDNDCLNCNVLPICFGGCPWYKLRNLRANAHFKTCCLHRDENYLKQTLIERYNKSKNN